MDSGVSQLEREISAMRRIVHDNILRLHSVLHDEQSEVVYLVLDYADYGSLDHLLRSGIPDRPLLKYIFARVLGAVAYLHLHGVIHQDIKPSNILLTGRGGVLLSDFGVGHSFQSAAMVVGSPAYQAPEALDDYSDEEEDSERAGQPQKEDIWALGVTLYQLLFLKLPFPGENLYEIVNYIRANPLEIPHGTDPLIVELLRGMLTVSPAQRYGPDEVLNNPLIRNAPDFAPDLPEVPGPELLDGPIVECRATVCPPGYSFVNIAQTMQEKLMAINAPYSPVFMSERSFPRALAHIQESESSDDDMIASMVLRK
jgi:serine/threonine-protein kinase 11